MEGNFGGRGYGRGEGMDRGGQESTGYDYWQQGRGGQGRASQGQWNRGGSNREREYREWDAGQDSVVPRYPIDSWQGGAGPSMQGGRGWTGGRGVGGQHRGGFLAGKIGDIEKKVDGLTTLIMRDKNQS